MTDTEKAERLETAISMMVRDGWRVEYRAPAMATMLRGQRPNHILHLILSLITCGLWLPVWGFLGIFKGQKRRLIELDEFGLACVTKA